MIKTIDAQACNEDILKTLDKDGCVIIKNLLTEKKLQIVQSDLDRVFREIENCQGDFYGYKTKRTSALLKKSRICQDMATHPLVLKVMDHFLLQNCSQYQINLTQGISIGPSEDKQVIHRDDNMFPYVQETGEKMINCMWAINDFTIENGATRLIPGSHLWSRENIIDQDQILQAECAKASYAEMIAGSVLIYFGSAYHSGGQNITDKNRIGAVISYNLGWLRQAENSYLAYSKDDLRSMPENIQKLLGYFVHKPNLGSVDGQDPISIINDRKYNSKEFLEFISEEAKTILRDYKNDLKNAA